MKDLRKACIRLPHETCLCSDREMVNNGCLLRLRREVEFPAGVLVSIPRSSRERLEMMGSSYDMAIARAEAADIQANLATKLAYIAMGITMVSSFIRMFL